MVLAATVNIHHDKSVKYSVVFVKGHTFAVGVRNGSILSRPLDHVFVVVVKKPFDGLCFIRDYTLDYCKEGIGGAKG